MTFDLKSYFTESKQSVDAAMSNWLPSEEADPQQLISAMRYSLFASGKRIRPVLVFATADALGLSRDDVMPVAVALEMIHVFSLVHDDLPAMDDDDLRRGQPTNHKVYGEAMAILAGDALLAQAFIPLTDLNSQKFSSQNILRVIRELSVATGALGMIGGQVIDMESEGQSISYERLKLLHRKKTGALIRAAVVLPAILSGVDQTLVQHLTAYAESIGLAFQIADDILDIEGGADLGKDIGSDVARGKSTYPSILGMNEAKAEKEKQFNNAIAALADFDDRAIALRAIARFIVDRKN